MLKRILTLLLLLAVLLSFSTTVLAGQDAVPSGENGADLKFNEDGKLVEVYLPYVAKSNANENSQAANNPIDVAGKNIM